ncbi:MAG: lipase [Corynebacteriales bacterium]|uniref:Lipase family protein n=1 Tax=Williamsia herbipolensis TaxID=1603258 RepID=A0AAU4K7V2_9NOCA|nr:lipase family protein [Williamsia herbipolensis]MCX6469575.1 lipase [Mycobacteriales bacterium]
MTDDRLLLRRARTACLAIMTATALTTGVAGVAQAAPAPAPAPTPAASPVNDSFYTPPSPLPAGKPGDIIRSENLPTAITIPSPEGAVPAKATRIMYLSIDANGDPIAVTGYYLQPVSEWKGPGPRPVVAYAGGLHGQGDQCAASKLLQEGVTFSFPGGPMAEIEQIVTLNLVKLGYGVVSSDYMGGGTPGTHTFGNRVDQAHAVIDAARAALHLPEVSPDAKVALAGYSQGGGATAAAAELVDSYAPELPLVGIYTGGVPADLLREMNYLDGNRLGGVIGYALNGASYRYPEFKERVSTVLNPYGKQTMAQLSGECIVLTSARGKPSTRDWTVSHKSFGQLVTEDPILSKYVHMQDIGNLKPTVPVLLTGNPDDPTVPIVQERELYSKWCAKGATSLQYEEIPFPIRLIGGSTFGHVAGGISGFQRAVSWLSDRFAGKPAVTGCSRG